MKRTRLKKFELIIKTKQARPRITKLIKARQEHLLSLQNDVLSDEEKRTTQIIIDDLEIELKDLCSKYLV